MKLRCVTLTTVLVTLATATVLADDVSDVERMVCAPMVVHECRASDGDCIAGAPWEFEIGPFVEIDLGKRRIATTDGRRATPIKDITRDGEIVIVHAYETGRALNAVISGPSGFITATITLDDGAITIFGACKPYGATP